MPDWPQLVGERIHVWRVDLEPNDGEFPDCLRPENDLLSRDILSGEELVKAKRFVTPTLRLRYSAAHVAMRSILGRYLNVSPAAVPIVVEDTGRPVIDLNNMPDRRHIHFNLTHSDALALVAVAESRPIGVDVERVRHMKSRPGVERQVYTDSEIERLQGATDAQWFAYWTAKEAVLKATGYGFQLNPRRVELEPSLSTATVSDKTGPSEWHLKRCELEDGWSATVATSMPITDVDLHDWHWDIGMLRR